MSPDNTSQEDRRKQILNRWGHAGYTALLLGQLLLSRHILWGWPLRFLGEFIWLVVGIKLNFSSIWFWSPVFLGVELYGLYAWW